MARRSSKAWLREQLTVIEAIFPGTQWWDVRVRRWRSLAKSLGHMA